MRTESFVIDENDLRLAQNLCSNIDNETDRNKCMGSALAVNVSRKYFDDLVIDTESGLHNIPEILCNLEIADIYINGSYIDVRVYFEDDGICVPKKHYDRGILPTAYMFIKLNEDLNEGVVTGFITPSTINRSTDKSGYYQVEVDDLMPFSSIESLLTSDDIYSDKIEDAKLKVYEFTDNKIEDKNAFYKELLESESLRKLLIKTQKAKDIISSIAVNTEADAQNNLENVSETVELLQNAPEDLSFVSDEETESKNTIIETEDLDKNTEFEEILIDANDLAEDAGFEEIAINTEDFGENTEFEEIPIDTDSLMEDTELEEVAIDTDELVEAESIDISENSLDIKNDDLVNLSDGNYEAIEFNDINQENEPISEYQNNDINLDTADSIEENESLNIDNSEDFTSELSLEATEEPFNYTTETTPSLSEIASDDEESSVINDEELVADYNAEDDILTDSDYMDESKSENDESIENLILEEDNNNNSQMDWAIEDAPEEEEEEISPKTTDENQDGDQAINEISENDDSYQSGYENTDEDKNIDTLFDQQEAEVENRADEYVPVKKSKTSPIIKIAGLLAIIAILAYFGYSKYSANLLPKDTVPANEQQVLDEDAEEFSDEIAIDEAEQPNETKQAEEAMPVETVENVKPVKNNNEGTAKAIPAIENNLGGTVNIQKLNVNWEVPASYVSNATAQRYFTKLGKIIQLNLKTELLLISKQPMSNRIVLELKYNQAKKIFEVSQIKTSSGEKSIDSLIKKVVQKALSTKTSINVDSFGNNSGEPLLIIKL